MKVNNREVSKDLVEVLVIPKGGEDYVFKAKPVFDFDAFPVKEPVAPMVTKAGGVSLIDYEDKHYKKQLAAYNTARYNWVVLQSLTATEGLEWDTVDLSDPDTWGNFETDLRNTGFSGFEVSRIVETVLKACGLDGDKIDKATQSFLASQVVVKS